MIILKIFQIRLVDFGPTTHDQLLASLEIAVFGKNRLFRRNGQIDEQQGFSL
jgi:hypothetical protein